MHLIIFRRIVGFVSRLATPIFGYCYDCGMSWAFTEAHDVFYSKYSGVIALCEYCWKRNDTKKRLWFYLGVFSKWEVDYPGKLLQSDYQGLRDSILAEAKPRAEVESK